MNSPSSDVLELPFPGWGGGPLGRGITFTCLLVAILGFSYSSVASHFLSPEFPILGRLLLGIFSVLLFVLANVPELLAPPIELIRKDTRIRGLPGGLELHVGVGEVVVQKKIRVIGSGKHKTRVVCYEISHKERYSTQVLFEWEDDPLKARAFAEGLARLGNYPLLWIHDGSRELRQPDELDLPLTSYLARNPPPDPPVLQNYQFVAVEAAPGQLNISWLGVPAFSPALSLLVSFGLSFFLSAIVFFEESSAFVAGLVLGIALLITVPLSLIPWFSAKLIDRKLSITPQSVIETKNYFGLHTAIRKVPSQSVESLYIDGDGKKSKLLLASDKSFSSVGGSLGTDAPSIHVAALRALAGKHPYESAEDLFPSLDPSSPPKPAKPEFEGIDVPW